MTLCSLALFFFAYRYCSAVKQHTSDTYSLTFILQFVNCHFSQSFVFVLYGDDLIPVTLVLLLI